MTPNDSPAIRSSHVAPRRAAPLTAAPKPPQAADANTLAAARAIARAASAVKAPAPPPAEKRPGLETKIAAAGHDADQILRTLDTEMTLRRAGRSIKGDDQIKAFRVLSVAMLFTLLIAALGAMSYMQTQFAGHGFKRRTGLPAAAVTASPAPEPSTPAAGPGRQSVPPTR